MVLWIFLLPRKFKFILLNLRSNIFIPKIKEGLISYLEKEMKISIYDCILQEVYTLGLHHFKGKIFIGLTWGTYKIWFLLSNQEKNRKYK